MWGASNLPAYWGTLSEWRERGRLSPVVVSVLPGKAGAKTWRCHGQNVANVLSFVWRTDVCLPYSAVTVKVNNYQHISENFVIITVKYACTRTLCPG